MTEKVKKQILAIRETGLTNMFDLNAVQRIAYDMDFFELVDFIEENKAAYDSRSTGELESSFGLSSVRMDKDGNHNIKIGFAEPRRDGDSNAKIANILEYGKHGQPAKPFLKPAKSASKSECEAAMKSKFEEEVGRI